MIYFNVYVYRQTIEETDYVYNGLNQLITETKGTDTLTYNYDSNGYQIVIIAKCSIVKNSFAIWFRWGNQESSLTSVTLLDENKQVMCPYGFN